MSQFESALQFYQQATRQAKRTRKEQEIPEDIPEELPEETKRVAKAESSSTTISEIKRKAREKVTEERVTDDNLEALLLKFKRFLTREKRERLLVACEAADSSKLGVMPFMSFNRVLKSMGFRLLFDQLKSLLNYLQVYNDSRDRVYYPRLFVSVLNKLYKPDILQPKAPMTALDAATKIKRIFRLAKEARAKRKKAADELRQRRAQPVDTLQLASGLAQKVAARSIGLLQVFQQIDTDGSGFIEMKELGAVFMDYGVNITQKELEAVFRFMDRDNKGKLSYRDLSQLLMQYTPTESSDILNSLAVSTEARDLAIKDLLSAMQAAINASSQPLEQIFGMITATSEIDFDAFASIVGKMTPQFGLFECRQVFNFLDKNKSGRLSINEFKQVFLLKRLAEPEAKGLLDKLEQSAALKARLAPKIEDTKARALEEHKSAEDKKMRELLEKRAKEKEEAMKKSAPSRTEEAKTKKEEEKKPFMNQFIQKPAPSKAESQPQAIPSTPSLPIQTQIKPNPLPTKVEPKPTLAEEIERKMKETEEIAKKTPLQLKQEELKRLEEAKQAEEAKKLEDSKKAELLKLEEVKKKTEEERKKPKPILKSGSESMQTTNRARFRKPNAIKTLTIEEKAAKAAPKPTESASLLRLKEKEQNDMIKREFLLPMIADAVAHGESLMLARKLQHDFERRPVVKHWFAVSKAWEQDSVNTLPRTLCALQKLGRVAMLDPNGTFTQIDVATGAPLPALQLGTRPPANIAPLLGAACDSKAGRIYTLDKQWKLNVWDVYQHLEVPAYSVRVLSQLVSLDYVERSYPNRNRGLNPTLLIIGHHQEIIVNATAIDGCLYIIDPLSLTVSSRMLLPLTDYELSPSVIEALDTFSKLIALCEKVGIPEKRAFELIDRNKDGLLTVDEMMGAIRDLKLPLTTDQVKGMVSSMDRDSSGSISLAEFHEAVLLRSQVATARAEQQKPKAQVPKWIQDYNINPNSRRAFNKFKLALDRKGYSADQIFNAYDPNNTGIITKSEFTRTISQLLGEQITPPEAEVLVQIADPLRSNTINYRDVASLLKDSPLAGVLSSERLSKDSINYVLHKCLELSVDLWKVFRTLDSLQTGSVPVSIVKQLLLTLPLGLTLDNIEAICDRDLSTTDNGEIDYVELLSSVEYSRLIEAAHAIQLGPFTLPPTIDHSAIIEDCVWLDDLEAFAYTTIRPMTSVIFIKQAKAPNLLLAKLIGHKFEYPPALLYVPVSNCLVSGERRPIKQTFGKPTAGAKCEVLLWNLQRDLINKFSVAPPWVARPYRRVVAHEHSILDLAYLVQSQLVVSTGFDNTVKLWNPTGTPYSLTEPHALAVAPKKPGYYKKLPQEYTQTNQIMSLVSVIESPALPCFKVLSCLSGTVEWLLCLGVGSRMATGAPSTLTAWNIQRFSLKVPAFKHDVPVPKEIQANCQTLMHSRLAKSVTSFKLALPKELDIWVSNAQVQNTLVKDLKQHFITGILFERYNSLADGFELASKLPFRRRFKTKSLVQAGWFRLLSDFGLLQHYTYQKFDLELRDIDNKLKAMLIVKNPTDAANAVDLSHWAVCTLKLDAKLKVRLRSLIQQFSGKLLAKYPEVNLISPKLFQEELLELKSFTVEEAEALRNFAIEGSRGVAKKLSLGRFDSNAKENNLINYRHFAEAIEQLVQEPLVEKPPVLPQTPQQDLPKTETKLGQSELLDFLANYLKRNKMSVQRMFFEVDVDASGTLSDTEFLQFMKNIGMSLSLEEVRSLIKEINESRDLQVVYKELKAQLVKHGYIEPTEVDLQSHSWEDSAVTQWLQCFSIQKIDGFHDYLTLLNSFDSDHDGVMQQHELLKALCAISPVEAEKVLNVLILETQGNVEAMVRAMMRMERDLYKTTDPEMPVIAVVEVIKTENALSVFETTLKNLFSQANSVLENHNMRRMRRGLELISYQHSLPQVLYMLDKFGFKLREFLNSLISIAHTRIVQEAQALLIDPGSNVQANNIHINEITGLSVPKLQSSQFKVFWDSAETKNFAFKLAEGITIPEQEPLEVELYNPEGLRHVSLDGTTLENHLNFRLRTQLQLQSRIKGMTKCKAIYERRVGTEVSDKELYLMYELPPGPSLRDMLQQNGGLLKIPLLYQSKASVYVWKFWGRQLLQTLFTVQSHSAVLRNLNSSSVFMADGGLRLAIGSLCGIGSMDHYGVISSAPDLSVVLDFKEDFYENPYIAPEYLLDREQTSSVDVWNFGVLMFEVLFGSPPPSFLSFYRHWADGKQIPSEPAKEKPVPRPCPNLFMDIYSNVRLGVLGAVTVPHSLRNSIDSIKAGSYSGIVEGQETSELVSYATLQKSFDDHLNTHQLKQSNKSDIGLVLDLISLCLQLDPSKRPTIRGLLASPLFQLDDFQQRHAEHFSKRLFEYKSPAITITQAVTQPLLKLTEEVLTVSNSEEVVRLIQHLQANVCSSASAQFASSGLSQLAVITKADREAVLTLSSTMDRERQIVEALKSPIAPLVRRMIEDGILDMLVFLALKNLEIGENRVARQLVELLSNLIFELYSYASPCSAFVEHILEAMLKLFVGEPLHLASCSRKARGTLPSTPYIQRQSYWTSELYHLVGPLYKDTISDNGLGQHYYPVIKDFISQVSSARTLGAAATTAREADYYSELISLAENMVLLKNLATGKAAKRTALRHIRSMLQTRNSQKVAAALDFRLPQHIIHLLHDDDFQVRFEAICVLKEISRGCLPAAETGFASKKHRQFSIANFFSSSKSEKSTKDFAKRADLSKDLLPQSLVEMSKCYESPVYIVPLVRLLKLKSEPYDNKEGIVRCLTCILRGTEAMIKASQTPATDLISTLCKSLVIASRNSDTSSSRVLAPLLRESLIEILALAKPSLVRAFEITPGAKALLRDQQIELRRPTTLQTLLEAIPDTINLDFDPGELAIELQRWLEYVYRQQGSSHLIAHSAVQRVVETLRYAIDLNWTAAESGERPEIKPRLAKALLALDWIVANEFDYLWFREPQHITWLMNRLGDANRKTTGGYVVYPLQQELLTLQRILCRLLKRTQLAKLLESLELGQYLALLFEVQFGHLSQVLSRNTESLHLLPVYAVQSDLRLTAFENLLAHPSTELKRQFVSTDFMQKFVTLYLPDCRVLDSRFNKLTFEFLAFRECAPLRGEAIAMMESLLRHRQDNRLIFDDLLLHMRRHNAVAFELQNLRGSAIAQTTALQVLDLCVSSGDPQLDYMLLQEEAQRHLEETLNGKASWQSEFPGLKHYLDQFK